jgi:hypothetical protein
MSGGAVILLSVWVCWPFDAGLSGAVRHGAADNSHGQEPTRDRHVITASGMGPVALGMTLDDVRRAVPVARLSRTSDGDGAALVEVILGEHDRLVLWADEDDPAQPIDWSKKVSMIETFSDAYHTREGVHPGSLVRDVEKLFGSVREIVESEIEQRQFISFTRQPRALEFRLDYTGLFTDGGRRTTRFEPGARILSIAVSSTP